MKKYFAEMIGTMVLVLMGCGAAAISCAPGVLTTGIGFAGVSLAFGLSVLIMVYAIGPISGCHINPAITIAMWINKKIGCKDALMYILFQVIGGFIGAGLLALMVGHCDGLAVNSIDPYNLEYTTCQTFVSETFLRKISSVVYVPFSSRLNVTLSPATVPDIVILWSCPS